MWQIKLFHIDLYFLFFNFFIYSFIGWIYESCLVSVQKKKWINRGFLNGPIIPIYGAGATLLHIMFFNIEDKISVYENPFIRWLIVFVAGMILATILEFLTSYIMELLFHARWWDYSRYKLNLQGRVCFHVSLFWGLLSLIMALFIQPIMSKFIIKLLRPKFDYIGIGFIVLFLIDLVITVVETLDLTKKLETMQKIRTEFMEYVSSKKIYGTTEELRGKLSQMHFADFVDTMKDTLEERIGHMKEKYSTKDSMKESAKGNKELKLEIEAKLKDVLAKYQKQTEHKHLVHKRIIRAFPNFRVKNSEEALKDYREKSKLELLLKRKKKR